MIRLSFYDFSNMTRIRLNRLHCIIFIRFVKKRKWKNSESLNTVYIYIYMKYELMYRVEGIGELYEYWRYWIG